MHSSLPRSLSGEELKRISEEIFRILKKEFGINECSLVPRIEMSGKSTVPYYDPFENKIVLPKETLQSSEEVILSLGEEIAHYIYHNTHPEQVDAYVETFGKISNDILESGKIRSTKELLDYVYHGAVSEYVGMLGRYVVCKHYNISIRDIHVKKILRDSVILYYLALEINKLEYVRDLTKIVDTIREKLVDKCEISREIKENIRKAIMEFETAIEKIKRVKPLLCGDACHAVIDRIYSTIKSFKEEMLNLNKYLEEQHTRKDLQRKGCIVCYKLYKKLEEYNTYFPLISLLMRSINDFIHYIGYSAANSVIKKIEKGEIAMKQAYSAADEIVREYLSRRCEDLPLFKNVKIPIR